MHIVMKIFVLFFLACRIVLAQELPLNQLQLPHGFNIEIFADKIPDARQMVRGDKGTIFVGTLSAGNVYAIVKDKTALHGNKVIQIASNLNLPNGVAFRDHALYVAESQRILRFDNIEDHLTNPPKPVVVFDTLPNKRDHGWRYLAFGPDGKLYISIGMPCNVCLNSNPMFGTISRLNADGTQFEIYAKGIRNSVGFDWDPQSHALWFTDNGRDWMGDDMPPDELNYAPKKNMHFGFPYYDGNIPDPSYGKLYPATIFTPPTAELPAHVAALGMKFYTGHSFPAKYQHAIFIAEHGSWNRTKKIGYQIILANLKNNRVINTEPFITGWLQGQTAWGRPVDILVMPDGALLISDDHAGVIYRVSYLDDHKV